MRIKLFKFQMEVITKKKIKTARIYKYKLNKDKTI